MKVINVDKFLEENVQIQMMDNGHWEYERIGVGVLDEKVFVCDLENVDDKWIDWFTFVKFDSVDECVKSGLESGWCVEYSNGYGDDDKYRFDVECDCELYDEWLNANKA